MGTPLTGSTIDSLQDKKMTGAGLRIYQTAVGTGVPNSVAANMVAQAMHETANFTSAVFKNNNNAFGYKFVKGARWQADAGRMSPEGDPYAKYRTLEDSTHEIIDWWGRRMKENKFTWKDIETPNAYVERLKRYGYFGDTMTNYLNGLKNYLSKIADYGKTIIADPVKAAKEQPALFALIVAAVFLLLNALGGGRKSA